MGFDFAGLPIELRNHILGYVVQLKLGDVARTSRMNKELNEHPLLLKKMLKAMQRLAQRASYDVECPCGVDTSLEDHALADAICVSFWHERRDDGITVERSALACRRCLQYDYGHCTSMIDPYQDLPAAREAYGADLCFKVPVNEKEPVLIPVRELSAVRERVLPDDQQNLPLLGLNSGERSTNPGPNWVLY